MWVLVFMWRLVDKRVPVRQVPAKYQSLIWRLGSTTAEILKGSTETGIFYPGCGTEL